MMFKAWSVVLLLAVVGCGEVKTNGNHGTTCNADGTCTNPSLYCDVDGSIGGTPNTCISVMCTAGQFKDCQGSNSELVCNAAGNGYDTQPCVNGCAAGTGCVAVSCTANQPLRCDGNQLVSCNADGNGAVQTACSLGCDATALKCKGVDPSNNLASNLDQAAQQGDVTLPSGTTINTDNGNVTGPGGAIAVANAIVSQSGGPMMRVLMAKSFTIGDVRVTGTAALAIVAASDITINGTLDLSADGVTGGPGTLVCAGAGEGGAPGSGFFSRAPAGNSGGYPAYLWNTGGGGGGGFGSIGGTGGANTTASAGGAGGPTNGVATLVPLRGGCKGGDDSTGHHGGAGGGAVQLVANGTVHVVGSGGQIHVGGGGGQAGELGRAATTDTNPVNASGGGGAGGAILVEASTVTLDASTGLWADGGGGGGWGACTVAPNGADAPPNASTPSGGACPVGTTPASTGGDGATTGDGGTGQMASYGSGGGGGGGLGRIRINTADAQYASQGATVRGVVTTAIVQAR